MSIYEAIIVTVIATVISAPIVAFIVWLARLIWSKVEVRFIYPYKMWVGEGAYDPDMPDGSFVFHKRKIKITLNAEQDPVFLAIKIVPKKVANFSHYNLRFVKRRFFKFWKYKNIGVENTHIQGIRDPYTQDDMGNQKHNILSVFSNKIDHVGGWNGYYSPAYEVPQEQPLWIWTEFKANISKKKKYYLSLQHRRGDERRKYVRMKVILIP